MICFHSLRCLKTCYRVSLSTTAPGNGPGQSGPSSPPSPPSPPPAPTTGGVGASGTSSGGGAGKSRSIIDVFKTKIIYRKTKLVLYDTCSE